MQRVVRRGTAEAEAEFAHSLHVECAGSKPGAGLLVPLHRRRRGEPDRPHPHRAGARRAVDRLRFAFGSCANYELGYFSAYRHLAAERPDLVLFLGDYIYEYASQSTGGCARTATGSRRPTCAPTATGTRNTRPTPTCKSCTRRRRASSPGTTTRCRTTTPTTGRRPSTTRRRSWRAARRPIAPSGSTCRCRARRCRGGRTCGSTAGSISARSPPSWCSTAGNTARGWPATWRPRGGAKQLVDAICPERLDPRRSNLGLPQEAWLFQQFRAPSARWNLLAQQQLMAEFAERLRQRRDRPLVGRLERLSGGARPGVAADARQPARQPGGARRRHPFLLGQRAEARLAGRRPRRSSRPSLSAARSPRTARRRPNSPNGWPTTRMCGSSKAASAAMSASTCGRSGWRSPSAPCPTCATRPRMCRPWPVLSSRTAARPAIA